MKNIAPHYSVASSFRSRFQSITGVVWLYIRTSLLNWSWRYYTCILPLIGNKVGRFNFFVGRKENRFSLFYHVFCWGDSMNETRMTFTKIVRLWNCKGKAMGWLLQPLKYCCFDKGTKIMLRVFRKERPWVRNLSTWYIFFYCFINHNA